MIRIQFGLGKRLAKKLHSKFIDIDEEVEVIAGMKISKIFELKGEEYFRLLEKKTIMKILNKENSIIAIGGGAFEYASLRNYILKKCSCIWLKCNINVLVKRPHHNYGYTCVIMRARLCGHNLSLCLRSLHKFSHGCRGAGRSARSAQSSTEWRILRIARRRRARQAVARRRRYRV